MKDENHERLMLLDNLKGYRVSKGEPDIRGWDVVASDKRKIGEVHELVIDTIDLKVRYLDVEVDEKILDAKGSSHVLVPVAGAKLDDDDNRVYLDRVSSEELKALPAYDHRSITRDFETNIASWFRRATGETEPTPTPAPAPAADTPSPQRDDFYQQEHLSDRKFWGERRKGRESQTYVTPDEKRDRP
ncbi:MAG TPA: PRC-barrel domain-containing protein [Thermoanaerobaculia bacterium]|nr:PRC-barrel domain-containing protein [Thermoanaerobaculia bacterium]